MKNDTLLNESNRATYCPEDDKIRLYVGRVPRPEYDALRAEGWTATAKQDCDFAAVWNADREDTALSYAGIIEDEDAGPDERAADRAERFGGYLDRNLDRATGHADRFDAGPSAHGYQNEARAYRAADRHDRIAGRAVNCWDKAEYWQTRTAGVVGHALYLSSPSVRMGRIKTLEAELRRSEASHAGSRETAQGLWDSVESIATHREKPKVSDLADYRWELSKLREAEGMADDEKSPIEQVRRAVLISCLSGVYRPEPDKLLAKEAKAGTRTAQEIACEWLEGRNRPADWNPEEGTRYTRHLKLRLAYENQMLEAQGGRAASLEMVKGGVLGGRVIAKVNKSNATGRVVSVAVIGPNTRARRTYGATNEPGTAYALYAVKTERLSPGSYSEPTQESLAKLAEFETARKSATAELPKGPALINPTREDAERLQKIIAESGESSRRAWGEKEIPTVCEMTQSQYSEISKGTYSRAGAVEIRGGGLKRQVSGSRVTDFPALVKVRMYSDRVIVLTDKPGKKLPPAVWENPAPAALAEVLKPENIEILAQIVRENIRDRTPEQEVLISSARRVGVFYVSSWSQFGFTEDYAHLYTLKTATK